MLDDQQDFQQHLNEQNEILCGTAIDKKLMSVRNVCYVILPTGKRYIAIDKKAPSSEELENDSEEDEFLLLKAAKDSVSPIIEISHPKNNAKISFVVEICQEHAVGLIKNYLSTHKNISKPDIHFIISAKTQLQKNNLVSESYIFCDAIRKNQQILLNENFNIDFAEIKLFNFPRLSK